LEVREVNTSKNSKLEIPKHSTLGTVGRELTVRFSGVNNIFFEISADGSSRCGVHELPMLEDLETPKRSAP
jgi:hypothetical protein